MLLFTDKKNNMHSYFYAILKWKESGQNLLGHSNILFDLPNLCIYIPARIKISKFYPEFKERINKIHH